jgi:hypothetical protein
MGVDFWICHFCHDTFPDCGDYTRCNTCELHWCSGSCAEAEGYIMSEDEDEYGEAMTSCDFCRGESAEDSDLLEYALEKLGMSRDDLESEYLAE